jgi:hypothetical protein
MVIKAKHIECSRIQLDVPKTIVDAKSYSVAVSYDNEILTMQLPRGQLFTALYESDGKCYCELLIPNDGVVVALYFELARMFEQILRKDIRFKNCTFVGHLRRSSAGTSCLRIKMPQNRSQILTDFVSNNGGEASISSFVKGVTIIPIVSVEFVYVINQTIGFNLLLKQVVII